MVSGNCPNLLLPGTTEENYPHDVQKRLISSKQVSSLPWLAA
jgi:hypothetical protein